MRLGLITERYGGAVVGGAERHVRLVASGLAQNHSVEVLTTCAVDAATWANVLSPGEGSVNGVHVRRFPVEQESDSAAYDEDETPRRDKQGAMAPSFIDHLRRHERAYDALIFFGYEPWTTCHGIAVAPQKSVLVPTVDDDPRLLRQRRGLFTRARAVAFNSPEEQRFLVEIMGTRLRGEVAGLAFEDVPMLDSEQMRRRTDGIGSYVTYVGPVAREKGCLRLFEDFIRYASESDPHLTLVLIGKAELAVPAHVNIMRVGLLSHGEALAVVGASRALILPSPDETVSLALLEAWTMGRPVLVNAECTVLAGQAQRANAGLYYGSYEEFAEGLDWLRDRPRVAAALGRSARAHVEREHSRSVVLASYERLLRDVAAA